MNRVTGRVPDFSKLPFTPAPIEFEEVHSEPWLTPEGLSVAPVYRASDIAGLDCSGYFGDAAVIVVGERPS